MKLIIIPPYKGANYSPTRGQFKVRQVVDSMQKKGQLEGVEVDIDDGYPFPEEIDAVARNEEFVASIAVGVIKKVREYSEMGKHDAIITTCDLEAGFFASRLVSKLPVTSTSHAAMHIASLIGNRFTLLVMTEPLTLVVRHFAQTCGLSDKLVSVRYAPYSSTYISNLALKHDEGERLNVPEGKNLIDALTAQCVAAIKEDRVDSIIFPSCSFSIFADEVRQRLDEMDYSEIPIICGLPAAVEMAKALVNMKLTQAPRAYPGDNLKAKPEFG